MMFGEEEVVSSSHVIEIVDFSIVFVCLLTSDRQTFPPFEPPSARPSALLEGEKGEVNLARRFGITGILYGRQGRTQERREDLHARPVGRQIADDYENNIQNGPKLIKNPSQID